MKAAAEPWEGGALRLAAALAGGPSADGAPWQPDFDAWPVAEAQRWRAVLVSGADGSHALIADAPVHELLRARVESACAGPVAVRQVDAALVDELLAAGASAFRALALVGDELGAAGQAGGTQELNALQMTEQASPVVRLLDATLHDALHDGASDLHFECTARGLAIRYRLDGVMLGVREVEGTAVAEQLVSRLKVMAELDIGERRLPQDGRFKLRMAGREIDFRLSVMPTVFGEDAVVRVLDRAQIERRQGQLTLQSLGFEPALRSAVLRVAALPHGMLLVTGPTGSGKTTTLYAAITETLTGREKVITIEDPVEYQLPGVVQIPVNDKKGLSFARGLRSVLRHDPDRVMVGEIRDAETAQIAVQAALTGHLVFSTVHANGVFDVIGRFMHMGLDMYNVVSALNAVLAQRLMRLNCTQCSGAERAADGTRVVRGRGCPHCRHTGYRGRRAVAELLLLDDALRDLIASRAPLVKIREAALARGMTPLREAALAAMARGETTPEEVDRVTLGD